MVRPRRFSALAQPPLRLLAAILVPLACAWPTGAQTIEREMFVSVLDQADKPVLTLGVPDFIVREDGRVREVLRARRATDVIDVALLVDTSQALGSQVNDVRQGLEAFIARMRPQAQISIVGLGDRPTIYTDFTNSQEQLAAGVGRIFSIQGAGTYTLEAVGEVLKGLEKRKPERSAIVVLWAGGPEYSTPAYEPLVAGLKARGTALHVIAIGSGVPNDIRTTEGRSRELLFDQGTTVTGGRRDDRVAAREGDAVLAEQLGGQALQRARHRHRRQDVLAPERTEVTVRPAGLKARGILIPARTVAK
jgi:hypothetical protein